MTLHKNRLRKQLPDYLDRITLKVRISSNRWKFFLDALRNQHAVEPRGSLGPVNILRSMEKPLIFRNCPQECVRVEKPSLVEEILDLPGQGIIEVVGDRELTLGRAEKSHPGSFTERHQLRHGLTSLSN